MWPGGGVPDQNLRGAGTRGAWGLLCAVGTDGRVTFPDVASLHLYVKGVEMRELTCSVVFSDCLTCPVGLSLCHPVAHSRVMLAC